MALEVFAAHSGIHKLLQDSGLFAGVPIEPGPYEGEGPAVVYRPLTMVDVGGAGGAYMAGMRWIVTAVAAGRTVAPLRQLAPRIHLALEGRGVTTEDGTVFALIRVRPYDFPYRSERGVTMQQVGGIYDVCVQGAPPA